MTKKQLTKRILLTLALGLTSLLPEVHALPDQGNYDNSFYASIVANGNVMNITGKQGNNILNWRTFSVSSGETVKFMDKNHYLNLVNGFDTSVINGTISGGGVVYLINPYGILFGAGATLDNVGSFVASTRDISDINQMAFLNDPRDTQNVLFSDDHASRHPDYFPNNSSFAPAISVAEIKLTNTPGGATKIMLDGPNGVILKDMDVFDLVSWISTKGTGGEVGIGTQDGKLPTLASAQNEKIYLTSGTSWAPYQGQTGIVRPYKQISNISELQAINKDIETVSAPYRYLLKKDIDASGVDFQTLGGGWDISGTFDGLGYKISNLKCAGNGLFGSFSGTIRNLNLIDANINGGQKSTGAVAGDFYGSMVNVYVSGSITGEKKLGGLVGYLHQEFNGKKSEIRNSHNIATIKNNGDDNTGGIVGTMEGSLYNVYNEGRVTGSETADTGTGGIAGGAKSSGGYQDSRILSVYNKGNVTGYGPVGGIVGVSEIHLGDTYNWGSTNATGWFYNNYWVNKIGWGGVRGADVYIGIMEYHSDVWRQWLNCYYWGTKDGAGGGTRILNRDELDAIFNSNYMKRTVTIGVTTPQIETPVVVPEPEPTPTPTPTPTAPANTKPVTSVVDNSNIPDSFDNVELQPLPVVNETPSTPKGNTTNPSNTKSSANPANSAKAVATSSSNSHPTKTKQNSVEGNSLPQTNLIQPLEEVRNAKVVVSTNPAVNQVKAEAARSVVGIDAGRIYDLVPINPEQVEVQVNLDPALKFYKSADGKKDIYVNPGYAKKGGLAVSGELYVYNLNTRTDGRVTMDIYNTYDAFGVVEYYDKDDNYLGCDIVKRKPSVIVNPIPDLVEKINDLMSNDVRVVGKHVAVEAPTGTTHIRVTNNTLKSIRLAVYDGVYQLFHTLSTALTIKNQLTDNSNSDDEEVKMKLVERVANKIIEKLGEETLK